MSLVDDLEIVFQNVMAKSQVRDQVTIYQDQKADVITDLPEKANATKKKLSGSLRTDACSLGSLSLLLISSYSHLH